MAINRTGMIAYMDARIGATANAKHRSRLEVVRAHMLAEINEDVDALLATISPNGVRYRTWGAPVSLSPDTHEAVRAFYLERKALGQMHFQYDIDRLVVTDGIVITDGIMSTLVSGAMAVHFGVADADPAAVYQATNRALISWPFDDTGLLTGEESYTVPLGVVVVPPSDVPAEFAVAAGH